MNVTREGRSFVITLDDGRTAGRTNFLDHEGERIFYHTEIGPEFSGQGLAGQLVDAALDATADEGLTVVPVCPYVKGRLQKHPEIFSGTVRQPKGGDFAVLEEKL